MSRLWFVGGEPRFREALRLALRQHAERHAGFHAQPAHAAHHLQHRIEIRPILGLAPRRAHAEAVRPVGLGGGGLLQHRVDRHQPLAGEVGALVVGRLRAIGAILGAAAGLDRQQGRPLDVGGVVMRPVHDARPMHEIEQRHVVDRLDLGQGPIVPDGGRGGGEGDYGVAHALL
ncbi:hypothetical protein M2437_002593 [Methylorubrum pseudosasae]|nr:hypothetical protein [Methylorubrum pseudosasae]